MNKGLYMYLFRGFVVVTLATISFTACTALSGMQQRLTVCNYDRTWDAALDAVKDRPSRKIDKDDGLIATDWLEVPMPGRAYGIFRRDMADNSKDRSRVTLHVKRLNGTTQIGFIEERQSWVFRGGSRLFGWAPTDPSAETMHDLENRLDLKLQEHGCSLTSH
ncbi:MAG: hypothetical protein OEY86_04055 [Nitrospira sp.]|nr:hypothetical protein [Nitrospira sp.]